MFIPLVKSVEIFGACESPKRIQGKNVGVMYSEADFGLIKSEEI